MFKQNANVKTQLQTLQQKVEEQENRRYDEKEAHKKTEQDLREEITLLKR